MFFDNDDSLPEELRGRLKQMIDRFGHVTSAVYNGNFELERMEFVSEDGELTSGYHYTYFGGNLAGRLKSVTLRVHGADVRRADYEYYGNGLPFGSLGFGRPEARIHRRL